MHVLSHHSSNPLEAHSSDPVNRNYKRLMSAATRRNNNNASTSALHNTSNYVASSDDPLSLGHGLGREATTSRLMGPAIAAGRVPARILAYDLDQAMISDDELGTPVQGEAVLVTPVKQGKAKGRRPVMEVDSDDDNEEENLPVLNGFGEVEDDDEDNERDAEGEDDDEMGIEEELLYDNENEEMDFDLEGGEGAQYEGYDDEHSEFIMDSDDEDNDMHDDTLTMGIDPDDIEGLSPLSSPQSSRPPSPDEYTSIKARPDEEQHEIVKEIMDLCKSVPEIPLYYDLIDRLGTGTFSSVYKAVDTAYAVWDNRPWLGNHPPDSSAFYQSAGPGYRGWGGRAAKKRVFDEDTGEEKYEWAVELDSTGGVVIPRQPEGRVYVAIKRIYNTSGPERIRNELEILETCRGCRHTSQLITAFRDKDQVVIVLPYQRNLDFREYYHTLPLEGVKCYMRCLLRALRDIHSRGIIHRDVKPANFLYDPYTGVGTLCDFGLASHMETHATVGRCFHTGYLSEKEPHGRNLALEKPLKDRTKTMQVQAREYTRSPAEKVGYPDNDRRPQNKANRAGTRGFRAPEVLLKCTSQTGAIDVWAAGIIMLFFLTTKFPIFQSNDDIEALMEIAVIIGRKNMEKTATLHSRTFSTNIKDVPDDAIPWEEFVKRLNPDVLKPNRNVDYRFYPYNSKHRDGRGTKFPLPAHNIVSSPLAANVELPDSDDDPVDAGVRYSPDVDVDNKNGKGKADDKPYYTREQLERHEGNMKTAFGVLEKLLRPESTKRISPRDALAELFLRERRRVDHVPGNQQDVEGDDEQDDVNVDVSGSNTAKYEWIEDDEYIPVDTAPKPGRPTSHYRAVCADLHHENNVIEIYKKCLCGNTCHKKQRAPSWHDGIPMDHIAESMRLSMGGRGAMEGQDEDDLNTYFQDISPSPVRNGEDRMWEEEYEGVVTSREVLGSEDELVSGLNAVWAEDEDPDLWCGRYRRRLVHVPNGMGVAIGLKRPCEFHRGYCFETATDS